MAKEKIPDPKLDQIQEPASAAPVDPPIPAAPPKPEPQKAVGLPAQEPLPRRLRIPDGSPIRGIGDYRPGKSYEIADPQLAALLIERGMIEE